jgi:hypothetical protein
MLEVSLCCLGVSSHIHVMVYGRQHHLSTATIRHAVRKNRFMRYNCVGRILEPKLNAFLAGEVQTERNDTSPTIKQRTNSSK